jgi:hypothetical protein
MAMVARKVRTGVLMRAMAAGGVMLLASSAWAGWVITTDSDPSAVIKSSEDSRPLKPGKGKGATEKTLDKSTTVTKVQGQMMCIERQKSVTIFNGNTSEQIVIMKEDKEYWKLIGEEFKARAAKTGKLNGYEAIKEPVKFVATGKEEKIGEFNTKEYVAQLPQGHTVTIWTTTQGVAEKARAEALEVIEKMSSLQGVLDFRSAPGYPIRTIHERPGATAGLAAAGKGGVESIKLVQTVTSIKEEEIAASAFEIPVGYARVEAPKMRAPGAAAGALPPVPGSKAPAAGPGIGPAPAKKQGK